MGKWVAIVTLIAAAAVGVIWFLRRKGAAPVMVNAPAPLPLSGGFSPAATTLALAPSTSAPASMATPMVELAPIPSTGRTSLATSFGSATPAPLPIPAPPVPVAKYDLFGGSGPATIATYSRPQGSAPFTSLAPVASLGSVSAPLATATPFVSVSKNTATLASVLSVAGGPPKPTLGSTLLSVAAGPAKPSLGSMVMSVAAPRPVVASMNGSVSPSSFTGGLRAIA